MSAQHKSDSGEKKVAAVPAAPKDVDADVDVQVPATEQMSVRESVLKMREKKMVAASIAGADRIKMGACHSKRIVGEAGAKLSQLPTTQRFFRQQKEVRAAYRADAVPLPGAESLEKPASAHTAESIAMHKAMAATCGLKHHIKQGSKGLVQEDAATEISKLKAKELRRKITEARTQQLQNPEKMAHKPHVLARPLSVNCRVAEREEASKTHTDGNEEAYKMVEQLNASAMGYTDTSSEALAEAEAFNARQRAGAHAAQAHRTMM